MCNMHEKVLDQPQFTILLCLSNYLEWTISVLVHVMH